MGSGWAVRGADAADGQSRGRGRGAPSRRSPRGEAGDPSSDGGRDPAEPDAGPLAVGREIALRALTVRARTRSELASILARRQVPDEVIAELLGRLSEVNLIDDGDFAASWVAGQERRQKSSRFLKQELLGKGVDAEVVDEALQRLDPESDERVASALVARRLPALRGLDRQAQYRRLTGLLARRGFSAGVIAGVVRAAMSGDPDTWE